MSETRTILPSPPTGYELPKNWYVIEPAPKINHIPNPSFEINLETWTGYSSVARFSNSSFRGGYSARIFGDGVTAATSTFISASIPNLNAGELITLSADVLYPFGNGGGSHEARIAIWETSPANIIGLSRPPSGQNWERISVKATPTTTTIGVSLYLGTNLDTRQIFFDGVQLELGRATTYFDGDSRGFDLKNDDKNYYWLGVPHQSASQRLTTRSGGKIRNFSEFGLQLTNYNGTNFTSFDTQSTSTSLRAGALYDRTVAEPREFSLSGIFCGSGLNEIQCSLFDFEALLKPNVANQDGLIRLLYQDCNCSGLLYIDAVYDGDGLAGSINGVYQQNIRVDFSAFDNPFFKRAQERGQTLELSRLVAAENLVIRESSGNWVAAQGNPDAQVSHVEYLGNELFAMGDFDFVGATVVNHFASYNLDTWSAEVSFIGTEPVDFTITPDGLFYVLETDNVTGYSIVTTWRRGDINRVVIKTWTDAGLFTVIQSDNTGGVFVGGDIAKGRIEYFDGASFGVFLADVGGNVYGLAVDRNNQLSVAGDFNTPSVGRLVPAIEEEIDLFCEPVPDLTPVELDIQINLQETNGLLVDLSTDNNAIPDGDSIASYAWSNDANANTAAVRDVLDYDLTPTTPPVDFITLTLLVTMTSGQTITQTILFKFVDDDDDTVTVWRRSDETKEYNLIDAVPFSASCCISSTDTDDCGTLTESNILGFSADDEIVSYDWSNDANANVYAGKSVTMDLTGTTPGGQVVVTLVTTTTSGVTNTNTVTIDYSTDLVLSIDSQTETVSTYVLVVSAASVLPFFNFIKMVGGQWDGVTSAPVCYDVVSVDNKTFVGTAVGLTEFVNGELQARGDNVGQLNTLTFDESGVIYAGGTKGAYRWDGRSLLDLGIRFSTLPQINTIAISNDGTIAIGYDGTQPLRAAGYVQVFYAGSVEARPRLKFTGPGRLLEVRNETTNQSLLFDYQMGEGEIITISLSGTPVALSSTLQTVPFSNGTITDTYLLEGFNDVVCFIDNGTGAMEGVMITQAEHHGINALCCSDDEDERTDVTTVPSLPCCGFDRTVVSDVPPGCNDDYEVSSEWYDAFGGGEWVRIS